MDVVAWTFHPNAGPAAALGLRYLELDDLLRTSDVVSMHLWATPDAHRLLNRERLALLKPTTFVANTARGALIDEAALVERLWDKRMVWAGLDVFETEALPQGHPLTALPNVRLTSHCAGMTPDSNLIGLDMTAENVANFLYGAPTRVVASGTR